ncbi:hypothetical protein BBP40_000969 [Aspergillus hancockii]|nr:hypothetical protein BBP40_000969 [Aspergillus hancockii]
MVIISRDISYIELFISDLSYDDLRRRYRYVDISAAETLCIPYCLATMTTSHTHTMIHDGGGTSPPNESHVQFNRAVNPQTSIEDYSRVMLEYTHNRMTSFADADPDKGSPVSRSSRSSAGSGDSAGGGGMYQRGPAPTSAGVAHYDYGERGGRKSTRDDGKSPF